MVRLKMPVVGSGRPDDPLKPKYAVEGCCNEHYHLDPSGRPEFVEVTVEDKAGKKLVRDMRRDYDEGKIPAVDVEIVGDETPADVWKRLGVTPAKPASKPKKSAEAKK